MTENFTIRASSFGALFDCGLKWQAVHLDGMKMPSSPRAHLGTAIHYGTAVFDIDRVAHPNGDGTVTAVDACAAFRDALHNPKYDVNWRLADIGMTEAEKIGMVLVNRYCNEISPKHDFFSVEMNAQPLLIDCGDGITIQLTGSLDRARVSRNDDGSIGISDIKTGKTASKDGIAKTKGHRPQLGTYELLFEHTTGIEVTAPAEIIGLCTGSKPDVGIGQIHNAKALLLGDDNNPGYLKLAAEIFRTGLFTPNPQSGLCSDKYCPRWRTCIYHD